ncbi:MAG: hypothetical protein JWQ11_897 [Rhizobacter sp.]|nr:hypothetical protein [Rhizobacter sp.]
MKSPLRPATQRSSAPVVDKIRRAIDYLRKELDETRLRMSGLESTVSDLERLLASIPGEVKKVPQQIEHIGAAGAVLKSVKRRNARQAVEDVRTKSEARGEAFLAELAKDGTLVSSDLLATTWAVTKQALHLAVRRGDLFSIKVAGRRLYLTVFQQLERDAVAEVCQVLRDLSASEQLVFWLRHHGGLRGKTVAQALEASMRKRVMEVAAGWAQEKALADADS